MTTPKGPVGGAHAGYGLYPCKDGRVAVAALEPHFAQRLCEAAGVAIAHPVKDLFKPEVAQAIARFLSRQSRQQLTTLSQAKDIPLLTLS
jgi:crotonobetainyl-CoA:carnitine CoA-transferase CaiB-like acyl-CoA transferase